MSGLLTCVTEPGEGVYGCCVEDAYILQEIDCVRQCLLALKRPFVERRLPQYAGAIRFGISSEHELARDKQDLQMLVELLVDIFDERRATILSTGTDPGVAAIWEAHDLGCVATYFRCNHGMNLREWFLRAGLYDPANVPAQAVLDALPVPYDVPCGSGIPSSPGDPGPWPPVPVVCEPTSDHTVLGTVDISLLLNGFQGPVITGTNLYYVQSIDVMSFGLPLGTPGAIGDIISVTSDGIAAPVVTVEAAAGTWSVMDNLDDIDDSTFNLALAAGQYVLINSVLYPYCAPIDVVQNAAGVYTIVSTAPQVAMLTSPQRYVMVEATMDGTTWTTITTIIESDIATFYNLLTDPTVIGVRFSYTWQNGECTCPAQCPISDVLGTFIELVYACATDCAIDRDFACDIPSGYRAKLQHVIGGQWVDQGTDMDQAGWSAGINITPIDSDFYRLVIYNQGCTVVLSCVARPVVPIVFTAISACPGGEFSLDFVVPTLYPPGETFQGIYYTLDNGTTWSPFAGDPGDAIAVGPFLRGVDEVSIVVHSTSGVIGNPCDQYVMGGGVFAC